MPDSWAISGRDLHLDLGRSGRRVALERALREAVQSGRLAPGTLLPPSRALAGDLGIARNTVAEAYTQLVAEGWLTARQGSGTRVADRSRRTGPVRAAPTAGRSGARSPPLAYDLRAGLPRRRGVPAHGEWLAAARTALGRAPSSAFRYADPQGLPELRAALAGYLARTRGVRVTPERVVVVRGLRAGPLRAGRRTAPARRAARGRGVPRPADAPGDPGRRGPAPGRPAGRRGGRGAAGRGRRRRPAHPGPPVPAGIALEHRAAFVQWARAHRRRAGRGRLRRRVPLRPAAARRDAGAGPRPRRLRRHGEQGAGARGAGWPGWCRPSTSWRRWSPS